MEYTYPAPLFTFLRATNHFYLITDDLTDLGGIVELEFNCMFENQVSVNHDVLADFHTYRLMPFVYVPTFRLSNHDVAGHFGPVQNQK